MNFEFQHINSFDNFQLSFEESENPSHNKLDSCDIFGAVNDACNFFNIETPDLDFSSPITGIYSGDTEILSDDVLGVNMQELGQLGMTDKDSLSLIFTHEMTHRELQGCEGLDSWAEESACDFMSGVMAGMNGVDVNGYVDKINELTPNEEHPYGFIRSEFVRMGAEYAEQMGAHEYKPTLEECLSELNYQYGKVRPLIDEIRNDVDAHNEVISKLLDIYRVNPDSIVIYDPEMLADPVSSNHEIQVVEGNVKGFAHNGKEMSPIDLALLHNDVVFNPLIWEARADGYDHAADSMTFSKHQQNLHDIYSVGLAERMSMKHQADLEFSDSLRGLYPDQIEDLVEFKRYLDSIPSEGHKHHHVTASEFVINKLKSLEIPSIPYPKILDDIKDFFAVKHPGAQTERPPHPHDIVLA